MRRKLVDLLEWGLPGGGKGLDLELLAHVVHAVIQRFARVVIFEPDVYPPERVTSFVRRLLTGRGRSQ